VAKLVFKFFEVNMKEDDVIPFIEKMEAVMKEFAGEAYHYRYYLEEPLDTTQSKTEKNGSKGPHTHRRRRFQ
jgi:hypothetical protein